MASSRGCFGIARWPFMQGGDTCQFSVEKQFFSAQGQFLPFLDLEPVALEVKNLHEKAGVS